MAELDVRIVEMLLDDDKPAYQKEIQQTLGITKYFYNTRIEAILRRLQLPYDSMARRSKATKRREERPRNTEPISRIEVDKVFVFSPPQPILITQNGIRPKKRRRKRKRRLFVENEDIFRWHDESADPDDFVGTPSEPDKDKSDLTPQELFHDSEHWEMVDNSLYD